MAYVITKSDEQKRHEEYVLRTFQGQNQQGNNSPTREQREAAEIIARRSAEAAQKYANK